MKKLIAILSFCIISTFSLMAQSSIGSVYGVTLGDTQRSVIYALDSQGKSGSWGASEDGTRWYEISSPILGSCTFQCARFFFKNSKLDYVLFVSYDGGTMDPNFQGAFNAYDNFIVNGNRFRSIYRTMKFDLTDKYGIPQVDDDEKTIWKSGDNQILLEYSFTDETNVYGWHNGFTRVAIYYKKLDMSAVNY